MESKDKELLSYACEKFEDGEYDAALEAFVLAYSKGFEQEWILENIYNCYMVGNEEAFREAYRQRMTGENVSYEECLLDFIPYRDGEYYIFDKEICVFRGIFSVPELRDAEPDGAFKEIEFSAAALGIGWDFRGEASILTTAWERKIYMLCHDARRCLSFWKIPELRECLDNIKVFSDYDGLQAYFHQNTSVYLPMAIYGNEEERRELIRIRNEEHQYRLTPEGRNTENVLLTIAIPTANRGNLLLKRLENLLSMSYDAEIEIAVSKNGDALYEEEYKRASQIQDARLHYHDRGKLVKYSRYNWHYVVEMSCGKYVMTISDEDDVFISALEHYLKLLSSNPQLCLVRPRNTVHYRKIKERQYGKKGWEAFDVMFLTQNHFPGMIVRRQDFVDANLMDLERYSDNYYYKCYPHEWWYLMLCQRGDCMQEPVTLNDDSHPADTANEWKKLGLSGGFVPVWQSYESRIRQFQGQVEFLQSVMKINDKEKFEKYLNRAIGKVTLLFEITREGDSDSDKFEKMLEQLAAVCIEIIEHSCLDDIQKEKMLQFLGGCCLDCIETDKKLKATGR